jgi:thiol-disulfide isomerase/thioredoxin
LLAACQPQKRDKEAKKTAAELPRQEGRATIALNDSTLLPFTFTVDSLVKGKQNFTIRNAQESVEATAEFIAKDSVKITLPVFANYILARWDGAELQGNYINPDAENYQLPFQASFSPNPQRFFSQDSVCCSINKKWRVRLSPDTEKEDPAIAYFEQEGNKVTGTFLTETGDYRFLEGAFSGNTLRLSAFDGAHLFYFSAQVESSQQMQGHFYSGRSYHTTWQAFRDDDFELADPDTLTFLKEGYTSLNFALPTLAGDTLSLEDQRFAGKPVIIQIMGSWCPNCMDETRYLNQIYKQYQPQGLEIIGLTFERARNKASAEKRAQKMISDLDIQYPVLMAGYTRADKASEVLPMLNHVMSYPTTIYLDANHVVQKIHTGFAGPGTPVYEEFTTRNTLFIENLINSKN